MRLIDGRFYVIDERGEQERMAHGQPEAGFESDLDAAAWAGNYMGDGWKVRQFSSLFTIEQEQFAAGTPTRPEEQHERHLGNAHDSESFDEMSFDDRLALLIKGSSGGSIERVPFAVPSGKLGDYARVIIRFPTGDGLVVRPCLDGTLTLAWSLPPTPRERVLHLANSRPQADPQPLLGARWRDLHDGAPRLKGVVVGAKHEGATIHATVRLTDAGRGDNLGHGVIV